MGSSPGTNKKVLLTTMSVSWPKPDSFSVGQYILSQKANMAGALTSLSNTVEAGIHGTLRPSCRSGIGCCGSTVSSQSSIYGDLL
jgi:hypothetical protein